MTFGGVQRGKFKKRWPSEEFREEFREFQKEFREEFREESSERRVQKDQPLPSNTPRAPSGPERIYLSNVVLGLPGQSG